MWLFELENIEAPVRIETQKQFGNRRPDIYVDVDDKSYVAIIESKIDSKEGENQLKAYERILSDYWPNAKSKILVYITKYNEDVGDEEYKKSGNQKFRRHKWSDLYKRFAKVKQENPEEVGALERELLKLMEDWELDGCINAAQLRSFITCFDNRVGERLTNVQDDAWHASGLGNVLKKTEGNWIYNSWKGEQYSPTIQPYGVRIWIGFRYDRRDDNWNVDDLEIPSPAVTLHEVGQVDQQFPKPSTNWTGRASVEGWSKDRWIRQPTQDEMPKYGDSLYDYYKRFFETVFCEIKEAIEKSAIYQEG